MTYLFDQQKAMDALAPLETAMGRHAGGARRAAAPRRQIEANGLAGQSAEA